MSQPGVGFLCSTENATENSTALTLSKGLKTPEGLQRPHSVLGAVHKAKGKPHVQANQQNAAGQRDAGSDPF